MTTPSEPGQRRQFVDDAHKAVDLVARYWSSLCSDAPPPVQSASQPGALLDALPTVAPEQAEPMDALLADVERLILPSITHWQHPGFFGYFPCNGSPPAVIGDLISTALGVQGMLWTTSPACTELEVRVCDWMARPLGLPGEFLTQQDAKGGMNSTGGGVIQGTASESTLVALLAARDRLRRADPQALPVVYCSQQAHSSILKAAMIAGLADNAGTPRVRQIATRPDWSMDPAALGDAMRSDLSDGLTPAMVCATLGTTGVMAFDDLAAVKQAIDGANSPCPVWLHADAAMAGAAFVCPEFRGPLAGADGLDSLCFNPHKWLLTSFDCGLFWTRHRRSVIDALSVTPEYLRNAASSTGGVIDYRDWQVPLGRRFRSLKLWFVVRAYGLEGLRGYIRSHVESAAWLESQVAADHLFELAAPRHPSSPLVCLALRGDRGSPQRAADHADRTRAVMERANASGRAWFSHTVLPDGRAGFPGRFVIRFAVGGTYTQRQHVEAGWRVLRESASACGST